MLPEQLHAAPYSDDEQELKNVDKHKSSRKKCEGRTHEFTEKTYIGTPSSRNEFYY